jgi:hypothetical protein
VETIPPRIFLAYPFFRQMKAAGIVFIAYTLSTPALHFVLD